MATALAHVRPGVRTPAATPFLATALAVAGAIHLALTPEHFAESALMGLGFGAAGLAQLGLGSLVLARSPRGVYVVVIAMSLALMALFAYNALVGLPFGNPAGGAVAAVAVAEDHHAGDEHAGGDDAHAGDEHAGGDDAHAADSGHHADGLALGGGQPVDALGIGTQGAQLAAVALAGYILLRARRADSVPAMS